MKMRYIKPECKLIYLASQPLMSTSQGNMGFEGEINPDEMEGKENNWGWDWSDDEETTSTSMWEEEEE